MEVPPCTSFRGFYVLSLISPMIKQLLNCTWLTQKVVYCQSLTDQLFTSAFGISK